MQKLCRRLPTNLAPWTLTTRCPATPRADVLAAAALDVNKASNMAHFHATLMTTVGAAILFETNNAVSLAQFDTALTAFHAASALLFHVFQPRVVCTVAHYPLLGGS